MDTSRGKPRKTRRRRGRNWRVEGYGLILRPPYFGIGWFGSAPRRRLTENWPTTLARLALLLEAARLLVDVVKFLQTGHF
jgi:hypothetical protein